MLITKLASTSPNIILPHTKELTYLVYCLSNPTLNVLVNNKYLPLYKIGFTNNKIETRLNQLNNTSAASQFKCELLKRVDNPKYVEKELHNLLNDYRYNHKREYFYSDLELIKKSFDKYEGQYLIDIQEHINYKNNSDIKYFIHYYNKYAYGC